MEIEEYFIVFWKYNFLKNPKKMGSFFSQTKFFRNKKNLKKGDFYFPFQLIKQKKIPFPTY